ncbi:DUF5689 domain-containing protein [uncultured Alistipes sp.]|uniref:DUF5689 domain-containing protein n=1 Tax=uncultured Alistipes sp. TaxID=538949 RepID=UPI0025A98EE3|nr:DUF5689 domain-containing protein [uncultured Alistipes sp.]
MKINKLFFVAVFGILCAGCYNDFDTPAPAKVWTDEDMSALGLRPISIKELKQAYVDNFSEFGGLSNTGSNGGWSDTKTLKLGAPSSAVEAEYNTDPDNMRFWEDAAGFYIKGKVISSDAQGNVYKSLYIDDGTAAIELKLCGTLYTTFKLNLGTMESTWVYVKLKDFYLGNYRMMLSLGDAPSNALNTGLADKYYANSNFESVDMWANLNNPVYNRVLAGGPCQLDASNIKVVNSSNYNELGQDDYGRLIRFEGVTIRYAGVKYQDLQLDEQGNPIMNPVYGKFIAEGGKPIFDRQGAVWYYNKAHELEQLLDENDKPVYEYLWTDDIEKPTIGDNPYPNWIVTDWGSPVFSAWYHWAYSRENVSLYGSVLMMLNTEATATNVAGVYGIRTSGYSRFAMRPIPADGSVGNVLGIYSIYSESATYPYAQYQITVNRIEDLEFPEESLLSQEWIDHNTPDASYNPPVKDGSGEYDE